MVAVVKGTSRLVEKNIFFLVFAFGRHSERERLFCCSKRVTAFGGIHYFFVLLFLQVVVIRKKYFFACSKRGSLAAFTTL